MIHFKLVEYLADRGYLRAGTRVMDVGTQNIMFVTEEAAVRLLRKLRVSPLGDAEMEALRKVVYFSTPRPGERTAFLHELLALSDVEYDSIDIVDGLKTTIFDLNFDEAPAEWRGAFDLIINCGTLEHVIHQFRALTFIHDLMKVGAYWFDQPPSVGFLNHGYFNYNPLFHRDIARANDHELIEAWYSHAGGYPTLDPRLPVVRLDQLDDAGVRARIAGRPTEGPVDAPAGRSGIAAFITRLFGLSGPNESLSYNFNAVLRKTVDRPLRLPLEIRTTHGPVGDNAQERYGAAVFDSNSQK